jgi:hypothetical protein
MSKRSAKSYEREIAGLSKALSDECANSYRLSSDLTRAIAHAVAWQAQSYTYRAVLAEIAEMKDGPYSYASELAQNILVTTLSEEGGVNESSSGVHGQQMSPLGSSDNRESERTSPSTSPPAESVVDYTKPGLGPTH